MIVPAAGLSYALFAKSQVASLKLLTLPGIGNVEASTNFGGYLVINQACYAGTATTHEVCSEEPPDEADLHGQRR